MIRTSKHNISGFANNLKIDCLDNLFADYKHDIEIYIGYIMDGVLPLKINLSSAKLPNENITHSKYKREIYKQASQILRSQIDRASKRRYTKYKEVYSYFKNIKRQDAFISKRFSELNLSSLFESKYFTRPQLNNISINLTNEFYDIRDGNSFDSFLSLKLPYFNEKGTRAIKINLPIKYHRQSNKYKDDGFVLRNNIQIKKTAGQYFISIFWNKDIPKKISGNTIGIDVGFRKLIVTSAGQILGQNEMTDIYSNIVKNKKRNSMAYKQKLIERDNIINKFVSEIDLDDVQRVCVEDLCNVKYKSKFGNKTNDLVSRWTYRSLLNRIMMTCEAKGIELVKVSPAYTSQTCSSCGVQDKKSRDGEFFSCVSCGYKLDADLNAAINIYDKGVYSPLNKET